MRVNFHKLRIVFYEALKEHPGLVFAEAERYIEAIEAQKSIDSVDRTLRDFQQLLEYVAVEKIKLKEEEKPLFKLVATLYYKPKNNNVIKGNFKHGLRSKSRL